MSAPLYYLPPSRRNQGAALVLVLCFAVLVAGLTVAFFSRATMERQVSNASANTTKVELLADAAMDVIVDDLKEEIITSSNTSGSGTNRIYIPKSGTNAMPVRQSAIASGSLVNLIRISSHNDTGTRAANVLSTGTSFNGRSVSLPRWNLHYLLPLKNNGTLGDSTPDASFTAPDWVILTRNGPSSSASLKALSSATDTNYAIGRYAYAIYDEGGLLDINAVGYPSTTTSTQSGPKGGLAYADLTQLTDASGNSLFTKTQIDQIVGWRNYATTQPSGTFPNYTFDATAATRYQSIITSGSYTPLYVSGTTYNGNSDHAILNRQQLIKLLQSIGTTSTEKLNLQNALQYLGTFSREVNGPTCSGTGTSAADYNPSHIFEVKVSGTFTRADGSVAMVGEPLVKNRFPLEKLALLEKMQGVSTLTNQDKDDIARYFGLDPVSDSNGYYRHWNYPTASTKYLHGKGTSGATGIMSLADVATQNREPDFFELLQAGIYDGSLGKANGRSDLLNTNLSYSFVDPDGKITLQILRIGANIIDQWDSDNYPTTITFAIPGAAAANSYDVYGTEDLPYINTFFYTASGPGTYAPPYTQTYNFSVFFNLWNPHQAVSNTGAYPSEFQLSPLNEANNTPPLSSNDSFSDWYRIGVVASPWSTDPDQSRYYWFWNGVQKSWSLSASRMEHFADTPSKGIISFTMTPSDHASAYREPTSSGTITLNPMVGFPDDTLKSGTMTWSTATAKKNCVLRVDTSTVYRIQFKDPNGTWRSYGTFVGIDNPNGALPGTGFRQSNWIQFSTTTGSGCFESCPKSDPRTFRFGSGVANNSLSAVGKSLTPNASAVNSPIQYQDPFVGGALNGSAAYRIDMWAVNSSTGGPPTTNAANPSYPDNDNVVRPGDASYAYPNASPLFDSSHGGPAARPVILNRPFRSVGELGYVFRDMPWKTLDLFSSSSADAALLDLFSLQGCQTILAGRLNPNTRQQKVLAAVIAGATQASGPATTVSAANASGVGSAIITISGTLPFSNRSELVTRLMQSSSIGTISTIKTERESVMRALADCANTRTWNLLIDVIAQVGKYPSSAKSLDQFNVEGEQHFWLHVAIDRYTGQVIDKQLEVVRE